MNNNYKTELIEDDVKTLGKFCPNCSQYHGDWWPDIKLMPFEGVHKIAHVWECFKCENRFVSIQDYN